MIELNIVLNASAFVLREEVGHGINVLQHILKDEKEYVLNTSINEPK